MKSKNSTPPKPKQQLNQRVSMKSKMQLQIQQIMAEKQASKERGEFPVIIPRRDKFPDEFKKALSDLSQKPTTLQVPLFQLE